MPRLVNGRNRNFPLQNWCPRSQEILNKTIISQIKLISSGFYHASYRACSRPFFLEGISGNETRDLQPCNRYVPHIL